MTTMIPLVRRRMRRGLWWLVIAFVVITFMQVLALRWLPPVTSAFMVARKVQAWRGQEYDFQLHYQWRDWSAVSPQLPIALMAAEDQKFPSHHGFDQDAIRRALAHNRHARQVRGASTITQQVAKNLFLWGGRSWLRKGLEAWYTVLIEALWPKQRILEVYANIAEFGDGIYGAEAAAQQFFGKSAARLGPVESARLAAVLPNPRVYNARTPGPFVQRRAAWIARQVRQLGGPAALVQLR